VYVEQYFDSISILTGKDVPRQASVCEPNTQAMTIPDSLQRHTLSQW